MLAIGRALMTNPQLLILDEATEGLAPLVRAEIWQCLAALKREGLTMIVIDKNIEPLLALADRHYIVEKGRIAWQRRFRGARRGARRAAPLRRRLTLARSVKGVRLHRTRDHDPQPLQEPAPWQSSTSTARSATSRSRPDTPLLWVIREQVGLTGTKYGCGVAQCGACSVHINGEVARSCVDAGAARSSRPTASSPSRACRATARTRCRRPGLALDVPQCGYCQSGQIMAAAALLAKNPKPTDARHRRGDDQHLPLRHLPAHPRGRPPRRRRRRRRAKRTQTA